MRIKQQSYMCEVGDAQKETYRVQYIGLSATVQSCDRVEKRVEAVDFGPLSVGFKPFNDYRLDVHLSVLSPQTSEDNSVLRLTEM